MTERFISSDLHLGHRAITEKYGRPWDTVEEMNEAIIERWNERVALADQVYIVGDVGVCSARVLSELIRRLNGRLYLVRGNHDRWRGAYKQAVIDRFEWIKDVYTLKYDECRTFFFHYPCYTWPRAHKGDWHAHGHCHGNLIADESTRHDVSLETHDYYPYHWDEFRGIMQKKTYKVVDHHGTHE